MTGSNKRGPIKVSGLVASGKVQVRDTSESGQDTAGVDTQPAPLAESVTALQPVAGTASNDTAANQPEAADDRTGNSSQANAADSTLDVQDHKVAEPDLPRMPAAQAVRQAHPGVQKILLALIDDSPYQPRKEYDPELIDALATTMNTAGHAEPIRVRKKADGRYELISGHRRKRAASSLGWTEIDAFVEEKDDRRAKTETMLAAIGSHGLSDFEIAGLLKEALDDGMVSTQRQLSAWSGLNVSKVNACLQMLQLPPSILAFLHRKPSLFSFETSRVIHGLLKDYPNNLADIERGVERIVDGKPQNTLKGWVLQAIKGRPDTDNDRSMIISSGKLFFTIKRDATERAVVVNCKSPDVDMAAFEKKLQAWLEEQASSVAQTADGSSGADQAGSK
jgi:ParB/RepB/Spo0J family partition protein